MKLRWYQQEAIDAVWGYFSENTGNPLIAMPTGTGKSYVIAELVRLILLYPGQRIMMLTHVKELIVQNMQELLEVWPTAPAGIYSAGVGRKEHQFPITFAGIGSVVNRSQLFGHIDIILIDEAHLVSPKSETMYRKFLGKMKKLNPRLKVIGLTATNYRSGLGRLTEGGIFTHTCYDITTLEAFGRLVTEGFLCPLIPKRTSLQYDLSKVRVTGDDYSQSELQDALDIDELTYNAVKEVVAIGRAEGRRHWLVFTSGTDHCINTAAAFDSMRVETTFVHSGMSSKDRDERIAGFKSGRYQCMVNNNILTTGFNFPALDMEAIMTATTSVNKWVQMLGRLTRPYKDIHYKKANGLVLDFGGNTARLGPINDPVLPKKRGQGGGGTAPVRLCPECMTYNHASLKHCVNCGHEFTREFKIDIKASNKEVMKIAFPVIEPFRVNKVIYNIHRKEGKPDVLKVTYYCGLKLFTEYICFEHYGAARKKAHEWWGDRSTEFPPETVLQAMQHINELDEPKTIRVRVDTKYPEVLAYEY